MASDRGLQGVAGSGCRGLNESAHRVLIREHDWRGGCVEVQLTTLYGLVEAVRLQEVDASRGQRSGRRLISIARG